jgi:hypothetical protein
MLAVVAPLSAGTETRADAAAPDTAASSGISAFVARVLEQLTLSAWLPAALLTASVAILLQFRSTGSINILKAVSALTANPVRVLVIMIPLLVVATVVTQAFSFETIRTLEGYWRRRGPASIARTLMIQRHVRRRNSIINRLHEAYREALGVAEPELQSKVSSATILNALKASLLEQEEPPLTDAEDDELENLNWRSSCDAWHLARIDHLLKDKESYPHASRILPTRLGNVMRSTEDKLVNVDGDVQGFVLRRYAMAPRHVQLQHDQFRNRLEMYCTLVFVSTLLVVLTPAILFGSSIGLAAMAMISGGFAALSVASYLAAIASAGGYCAALREMDKAAS